MANSVKPVNKPRFRAPGRAARTHTPAKAGRAGAPARRAAVAIDRSPIHVGRGPIPTATGIAHQLGWLEREAALDGTPLTVGGGWTAGPPRDALSDAAAPPVHLREGESTAALWERSEGRETRLIGLTWVDSFQSVVALADAGIRGPEQLAGRRLALPRDRTAAITVDADLLEREPNLVVRLLAVLLRAGAWAQLNAQEATRLLARETHSAVRDVTAAHGANWPDQLHVDLSHRKLDALRAQHDFLVTHGFLPRAVDLGAWIEPRPLGVARELLAAERTAWR